MISQLQCCYKCCEKAKAITFCPRLIWIQHCALSYRFSHIFPFLPQNQLNFASPGMDVASFEVALLNFIRLALPSILSFRPSAESFFAAVTTNTQSYNVQATNWQHVWALQKCMMPVWLPPCNLHWGTVAIPRTFKIQPDLTQLGDKYKTKHTFDEADFRKDAFTEWTWCLMMMMQSYGLSVSCDWITASATYIYIFLLFSVLSKKGEMVLFSETRMMSIHDSYLTS